MSEKSLVENVIGAITATPADLIAGTPGKYLTADVVAPALGAAVPDAVVQEAVEDYFDANPSIGNVVGVASSVNNEIALFNGTGGKTIKRGPVIGEGASANFGDGGDEIMRGNDSRVINALQLDQNLSDLADPEIARENLGVEIGEDVQGFSHLLDSLGGLGPDEGDMLTFDSLSEPVLFPTAPFGRGLLTATSAGDLQVYLAQRPRLFGNLVLYVRTDGDNANGGTADNAGGALQTIQQAFNLITGLDFNGYTVEVRVSQAGTYAVATLVGAAVGALADFPVTVTATVAGVISQGLEAFRGARLSIVGGGYLKFVGARGVFAADQSTVKYTGVEFGACTIEHVLVATHSTIIAQGAIAISGGAPVHMHHTTGSVVSHENCTVTITNTPHFSVEFDGANQSRSSWLGTTFTGSATGKRYLSHFNSHIQPPVTSGDQRAMLPGNAQGECSDMGGYGNLPASYTPTSSTLFNLDGVTTSSLLCDRVNDTVRVYGKIFIDYQAAGYASFMIGVPGATTFIDPRDASGMAIAFSAADQSLAFVAADATNNKVLIGLLVTASMITNNPAGRSFQIDFSYRIQG